MQAGFARVNINPPIGTLMYGFGGRDKARGCGAIHDDIFARACYIRQGDEELLVMGFDLLFFSRAQADRYKGAIGARLDLSPRQILLNTSHSHAGPMLGHGQWCYADYFEPDRLYLDQLERAFIVAAEDAKRSARDVTVWSGTTTTTLPLNRRRPDGKGGVTWAPHTPGPTYNELPLTLLKDKQGVPVCLLFSVSCHPSSVGGHEVSADYPGLAMDLIDKHMGVKCSLFLQGAGGDTKAIYTGKGDHFQGSWEAVENGGKHVGKEVIDGLSRGLTQVEPALASRLVEVDMPLEPTGDRESFLRQASDDKLPDWHRWWAQRQVERIDRRMLPATGPLLIHGVNLGGGLRMIGVEAEIVAEIGSLIRGQFTSGITFPLGYCDGTQFYLPSSRQIATEGGYEVDSYHEYGHPAKLRVGVEQILTRTIEQMFAA